MVGTIKLQHQGCSYCGEPPCESEAKRVPLDLVWEGSGAITDTFVYHRRTRERCEVSSTSSERRRDATVQGRIGARSVRLDGAILRHDVQFTEVCR